MRPVYRRAIRDGLVVAGIVYLAWRFLVLAPQNGHVGADAWAYWVLSPASPYALPNGVYGAFLYPPPAVRLFAPATLLSWPQFWLVWTGILVATAIWLGGRRWLWVLAFPPVALELYYGNVNLLISAAIALGFRYPAAWSFVLLTKVTPGVGLLWFAQRRQWRALAIAIGVTALIAGVSFLLWPDRWFGWLALMTAGSPPPVAPFYLPFWPRFAVAVAIVVVAAWRGWRWPVVVASCLALPQFYTLSPSMLVGVIPFARESYGRWAVARRAAAGAET